MKAEHADALVQRGEARVGRLLEYQNKEKCAAGILDEAEGTKTLSLMYRTGYTPPRRCHPS